MRFLSTIIITFWIHILLAAQIYAVNPQVDISSPVNYIPQSFDVLHYSAFLDFRNAPSLDMIGRTDIKVLWIDNPSENLFYFHLRGLTVDSVKYNNELVEFKQNGQASSSTYHYSVSPPQGETADTVIITVYYHGIMTNADSFGGVFSDKDVLYSVGVGFRNNYVSSTQHWLACYDHPSDKATFDFTFITSKDISVASNGTLVSEEFFIDGNSELRRTKWADQKKIATNLMTFACADYVRITNEQSEYPIVIYCKQQDSIACEYVFRKIPDMVTAMQNRFGKYLFDKVGYVITPLSGGAMEHQTMITMNENQIRAMYQSRDTVNETAVHELSHHWFGNSVTPYDYRDAWFNEGFATFAANTWLEEQFDYDKYLDGISAQMDYYLNTAYINEGIFPLYDYPRESPSSNYPIAIYYKGCAVAAMLRYELGDDIFFKGLTKYLDSLGLGNMTTTGFVDFFEKYSGRELDWFFDQWIYGEGFPEIDITTYKRESSIEDFYQAEVHISQVQRTEWGFYKNLPIEIMFAGLDGRKVSKVLIMNEKEQVFVIDSLPDFHAPVINRGHTVRTLVKIKKSITSIEESQIENPVLLFPNPVENVLNIRLDNNKKYHRYIISDLKGQEIFETNIKTWQENNSMDIWIGSLAPGLYYITFFSEGSTETYNFLKI